MSCTIRPHLYSMVTPIYFPALIHFGPCSKDVSIYFHTLCACIVHDVCIYIYIYIYLLIPFGLIVTVRVT